MNKQKLFQKINPKFLLGIAHRGLHNEEFTENGLKAFQNAIDNDVAFEFDIHLTKDNELVVCHDEDLVRTTGKSGIIEDLTLEEIKSDYRLLDGGEIPTLQEVLDLNKDYKVPMVIELKVFRKNYKPLAQKAYEMLGGLIVRVPSTKALSLSRSKQSVTLTEFIMMTTDSGSMYRVVVPTLFMYEPYNS